MSYDMIDRFLRNNLDDDDYAEHSAALDSLCAPPPANKLTREQATAIMRMARELENSGAQRDRNREVQCALQDYLDALVSA